VTETGTEFKAIDETPRTFKDLICHTRQLLTVPENHELIYLVDTIPIFPESSVGNVFSWFWMPTHPDSALVVRCLAIPSGTSSEQFFLPEVDPNFEWTAQPDEFGKVLALLNISHFSLLPKLMQLLNGFVSVETNRVGLIEIKAYAALLSLIESFADSHSPPLETFRAVLSLAVRLFVITTMEVARQISIVCSCFSSVYLIIGDREMYLNVFELLWLIVRSDQANARNAIEAIIPRLIPPDHSSEFCVFEKKTLFLEAFAVFLSNFYAEGPDIQQIVIESRLPAHALAHLRAIFLLPWSQHLLEWQEVTLVPAVLEVLAIALRRNFGAHLELLASNAHLLRVFVFLANKLPDSFATAIIQDLSAEPSPWASRIPTVTAEITRQVSCFVCTVCGKSEGESLGFSLLEGGDLGVNCVHKACCPSVKTILPCAGSAADEFAAAVKPEDCDEFTGIVRFTTNFIGAGDIEKLPLVPFLVSAGFSVLARTAVPIESRVESESESLVLPILPVWLFGCDDRKAVYAKTVDRVLAVDDPYESTILPRLLLIVSRLRALILRTLLPADLGDSSTIIAAIAREGRILADAIRSDIESIEEQLLLPPDALRRILCSAV
jgi:hypothetical protein